MRDTMTFHWLIVLAGFSCALFTAQTFGQDRLERKRDFSLRTGETDALIVDVHRSGRLQATAAWSGPPTELVLSIWPSGADTPIRTTTGPSPLSIDVELDEERIAHTVCWQIRIAARYRDDEALGTLFAQWPRGQPRPGLVKVHDRTVVVDETSSELFVRSLIESESPRYAALIRLAQAPSPEQRRLLKERGIELLDRVANNTYQVAITRPDILAFRPQPATPEHEPASFLTVVGKPDAWQNGLIRGLAPLRPRDKIESSIDLGRFSRFTVRTASNIESETRPYVLNEDGTVNLTVHFLRGTSIDEMMGLISLCSRSERFNDNAWVVTVGTQQIRELANSPAVTWIEAAPMPLVPENDVTRAATRVDELHAPRPGHRPMVYLLSGRGDLDALFGTEDGHVWFVENEGTVFKPLFASPKPLTINDVAMDVGSNAVPVRMEINGDGVVDLLVGTGEGTIFAFVNLGTDAAPNYVSVGPIPDGTGTMDVGTNAAPCVWDVDGDGNEDLIVGNGEARLWFVKNETQDRIASFASPIPLTGPSLVAGDAKPIVEDIDDDGDLDLIVGAADGTVVAFGNSGSPSTPLLEPGTLLKADGEPIDVGEHAAPAIADLDGDGSDDLVIANADGQMFLFRSTGWGSDRSLEPAGAFAIPLPAGARGRSAVLFGDLDLDGVRVANAERCEPDSRHRDFRGRVVYRQWPSGTCGDANHWDHNVEHATHVVGIMGSSGEQSHGADAQGNANTGEPYQWRGMSPGCGLVLFSDLRNAQRFYSTIVDHQAHVINASIGVSQGGEYNGLNQLGDQIIRGDAEYEGLPIPPTSIVFSAGNAGAHGYFSLTKQHKNAILVGNWDASTVPERIRGTSSLGPTTDGRLKPDVVATGTEIISTSSFRLDGYVLDTGTSMASPAVAGVIALMLDAWQRRFHSDIANCRPLPSTLRALLIHTARDIDWSSDPDAELNNTTLANIDGAIACFSGPDFVTGWGLVDSAAAVAMVKRAGIMEREFEETGDVWEVTFEADSMPVKVTLAWDDPAATASAQTSRSPLLVNDLDLELIAPDGTISYPFAPNQRVLAADGTGRHLSPEEQMPGVPIVVETLARLEVQGLFAIHPVSELNLQPAARGRDHLNNVEQVIADGPTGIWRARVRAFDLQEGPQSASLVGPWDPDTTPPQIDGPAVIQIGPIALTGLPTNALVPSLLDITVTDDRDPDPHVRLEGPETLPPGDTTIAIVATDLAKNSSRREMLVRVLAAPTPVGSTESEGASDLGTQILMSLLAKHAEAPGGGDIIELRKLLAVKAATADGGDDDDDES